MLVKADGNFSVIPDETYWGPNWHTGLGAPIWAMRNRSGGDAYRRNVVDLFWILIAKADRLIRDKFGRLQKHVGKVFDCFS